MKWILCLVVCLLGADTEILNEKKRQSLQDHVILKLMEKVNKLEEAMKAQTDAHVEGKEAREEEIIKMKNNYNQQISKMSNKYNQQTREMKNNYDLQFNNLKAELTKQSKKLSLEMNPIVAFNVALSHHKSNAPSVIRFDRILHHYGNCWNQVTHVFVAPVSGLYSFTLTIMNWEKHRAHATIFLDKTVLQSTWAPGDTHGNEGTASAVVKVIAGQHVYAFMNGGRLHSDHHQWIHFLGFLIQRI